MYLKIIFFLSYWCYSFIYSPLGKAFKKTTKAIENEGKKQIKAIEDHVEQLVESNELIKKDFKIDRDSIPHEEHKKEYLMDWL